MSPTEEAIADPTFQIGKMLTEIRKDWDACGDAPWDATLLNKHVGLEPKAARLAAGLHNAFPEMDRMIVDLVKGYRRLASQNKALMAKLKELEKAKKED